MNHTDIADLLGHSAISIAERYGAVTPEPSRETLARKQLFTTLIDVETRARADRLAGYREYLAATVHQVSPVLLDLCRHEQLDLDAIAWRMPAADPRPTWLHRRNWLSVLHLAREREHGGRAGSRGWSRASWRGSSKPRWSCASVAIPRVRWQCGR